MQDDHLISQKIKRIHRMSSLRSGLPKLHFLYSFNDKTSFSEMKNECSFVYQSMLRETASNTKERIHHLSVNEIGNDKIR